VLELGAGTGRATEFLARAGGRLVAAELSPELLLLARRRLAACPQVRFLVADLRHLALRERFDLIVAVDDPLVHLTGDADRDRAFAVVARHLAAAGRFVLDSAWFPPEERREAATERVRERAADGGRLRVREIWHCDPATRLCTARFEYWEKDRLAARASFPGRLWSVEELELRAHTAGLRLSRLWGDYDGRDWHRASSPRLIAEMRRHP
jgi:SAM-dependent methyltransferase